MGSQNLYVIGAMVVFIIGFTYFFSIRPQQKQLKEHNSMLDNLQKGDKVMTAGGFIGKVEKIEEEYIILKLEPDGISVKIFKNSIVGTTEV